MNHLVTAVSVLALLHIACTYWRAVRQGQAARQRAPAARPLPQSWPQVSILVPAWQEAQTVGRCIQSLQALAGTNPPWEAIIVAGGADGTLKTAVSLTAADARFQVIPQQPLGKNAALNAGLRQASGDIIVLLDADSQVAPDWLAHLVAPLVRGETAASTGSYLPLHRTAISRYAIMAKLAAYEIAAEVTLQGSGSIALTRALVQQLGGFPEDVAVGVDWDLHQRLVQQQVKPHYVAQALLHTERPATLAEFWRNEVRWRRAHLTALWRHRATMLMPLPTLLANTLFYGVALLLLLLLLATLSSWLSGWFALARPLVQLTQIFLVWLVVRRAALAAQIAAYRDKWHWLRLWWVPPLLLLTSMVAAGWALLTLRRLSPHFKGPRAEVASS